MKHLCGKFIVFDGGEGCGKSTQARLVREELEKLKVDVLLVRDPGSTKIGEMIRGILLNPDHVEMNMRAEMLLYMAARAQMMQEIIRPALEAKQVVISDRFVSSTLAYQLGGDGLTAAEIRKVADIALHGRLPDLTIIFDLPLAESRQRVQPKFLLPFPQQFLDENFVEQHVKDRIEQRSDAYHEQVRQNYLKQAKADPKHHRVIDATQEPANVHADVMAVLKKLKQ